VRQHSRKFSHSARVSSPSIVVGISRVAVAACPATKALADVVWGSRFN
jgi:hypothetical protein